MTKTFRDEEGNEYRATHRYNVTGFYIEPLPKPKQTEAEILEEMDRELANSWVESRDPMTGVKSWSPNLTKVARAIVAATLKIVEGKK
jgi:hypothetical protein